MKKKILAGLIAGAMALSLAACGGTGTDQTSAADGNASQEAGSGSTDRLQEIQDRGYIIIATEGDWSPWTFHDEETNELTGFDVELGKAIAEKLGVEAQFEETDWDSILAGVDAGRFDIACNGVGYTEERAEKYDFSEPYAYSNTVLVVRSDNEDITCMEDLNGKTTANTASSTYAQVAEDYGATVTPVNTLQETIDLLLQGRIDATLNAADSIADYMSQHPDAELKIVTQTAGEKMCIPVTKSADSASLLEAINGVIDEMKADGSLKELSEKFFGMDMTEAPEE